MKILHVIPSLDPVTGGPPLMVSRLAVAQAMLGHQVETLSYGCPPFQDRIDAFLQSLPNHQSVKHNYFPPLTRREHVFAANAGRVSASIVSRMDIVHFHGIWDPVIRKVAAVTHGLNIPYVITPHGMLNPWTLTQSRWKKRLALMMGYRRMIDRARFLHVLNIDEQRLVAPLAPREKTVVIPNGIFIEEIEPLPARGSFYAKHPELGGKPYILFLARLHYKKGLDYLADIFARVASKLPDVQLVVAGPDSGAGPPFKKQIDNHGLTHRVHLVGALYHREKYAALVDAACFCLPSREEGFSIAILEAMACGLPVVISDACHFPEVAQHHAGLVSPLDPTTLSEDVLRVLSDAALHEKMSAAGKSLVQDFYTWPKIAGEMIAAYSRIEPATSTG